MKKIKFSLQIFIMTSILIACSEKNLHKTLNTLNQALETTSENDILTNSEVVNGLKQALEVGTRNATNNLSRTDGFYKNPVLFIPFPPEAERVKTTLTNLGFDGQIVQFEETLNRAAEEATKTAAPIFIKAISNMTIQDGFEILKGSDNAATEYLKRTTSNDLRTEFQPVVQRAIETVNLTSYWQPLASRYNSIPLVNQVNPDLEDYVTTKALDGLFFNLAKEEKTIRENPHARGTELLKRVFGSLDE